MTSNGLLRYSLPVILSSSLLCVIDSAASKVIFQGRLRDGRHRHRPGGKVRRQVHDSRRCVQRAAVARARRRTKVTVEEGSDTYMSFYMYMAEPPKDRDDFFYWEGTRRRNTTTS